MGRAIRFIDGVKVLEHGGALSGFRVKLKFVPARRFAIAVLTNSSRGSTLGDRVAGWAFEHFLELRMPSFVSIALPDEALAHFAGRYRTPESEATFTVEDGGLCCVAKDIDPARDDEQIYPPSLLKPLSEREFVVVTQGENEGAHIDFIEANDGTIRFLRMDGRLYDRVTDEAHR
jgi:hypothetical protein